MIQAESRLTVADNSGAKEVRFAVKTALTFASTITLACCLPMQGSCVELVSSAQLPASCVPLT